MRYEREGGVVFNGGSWGAAGKRRVGMVFFALLAAIFAFVLLSDPAWAQVLSVQKSDDPDPVLAGEVLTYTIVVSNTGVDAENVVLEDPLPANTTFVSASANCTSLTTGASSGTVRCDLGTVAEGTPETVTIRVRPTAAAGTAGTLTNTATADGTNTVPAFDMEPTVVTPAADLSITKEANPDPVAEGDLLVYTLEIRNDGPNRADSVEVRDILPGEVRFLAVDASKDTAVCSENNNVVECDLLNINSGGRETVTIFVQPTFRPPYYRF